MASAAATVKKVALELGGKNPNIVFADADLEVGRSTTRSPRSSCTPARSARPAPGCWSRRRIHDEFVDALVERAGAIRLGGPHDDEGRDRPADQRRAPRQGRRRTSPPGSPRARCCAAAARRPTTRQLDSGFYYLPTILDRCTSDMTRDPGRVLRAGAHRRDLHRRGRRGRDRQRQHLRPGRRGLDPGRRQGPAGRGPAADGHGLDQRLPPLRARRPSGAATSSPASAASSAWPGSRSTARPSTSGTTSAPPSSAGSRA